MPVLLPAGQRFSRGRRSAVGRRQCGGSVAATVGGRLIGPGGSRHLLVPPCRHARFGQQGRSDAQLVAPKAPCHKAARSVPLTRDQRHPSAQQGAERHDGRAGAPQRRSARAASARQVTGRGLGCWVNARRRQQGRSHRDRPPRPPMPAALRAPSGRAGASLPLQLVAVCTLTLDEWMSAKFSGLTQFMGGLEMN